MNNIVKQVAGIDVAKEELVVCMGTMSDDWTPRLYASKTFQNNTKGFEALLLWAQKQSADHIPLRFVMEATGVYHEMLAYYLEQKGKEVSIVLPNKISNYIKTLETKTITDQTAAAAIAQFGLERKLHTWKRPKEIFRKLRALTRERDQIIEERTVVKNQLHADQTEACPAKTTLARLQTRIKLLSKQEKEIRAEIASLIASDVEVKKLIVLLCSITGIGVLTASIVLAETNGFELIRNKRQLASYGGFDVKEKQSGISVKAKPKISKKGNKYLRKAMHLPALTAIKHDERFKAVFARIVCKHGIKMKAVVAVQRKLLEMTYTVFKTNKKYEKDYLLHTAQKQEAQQAA